MSTRTFVLASARPKRHDALVWRPHLALPSTRFSSDKRRRKWRRNGKTSITPWRIWRARTPFHIGPREKRCSSRRCHPTVSAFSTSARVTAGCWPSCSSVVRERRVSLYREIWEILEPGGVFCNLEHVSSPTSRLHQRFLDLIGGQEDESNILLDIETQLLWLRDIGFEDVDCLWKWRELALLAGVKPRA